MTPTLPALPKRAELRVFAWKKPLKSMKPCNARFSIDGPVLVDVVVAKEELAIPPHIKLEQAKGFSLYMLRAIISGRGDEVIELAKTNWLR